MMATRMRWVRSAIAALVLTVAAAAPALAADPPAASDAVVAGKMEQLLHGPGTQVLGNPNGDVTIIEFFDYACPFCKAIEPKLQALLAADKGVKLVVKEFPILTPASLVATKAALASVKQGKYAPFHQAMMLNKGSLTEAQIFDTAKRVGLNEARLRRDMADPAIADAVYQNLNLARSLRIFGTPGIIVGGHIRTEPSGTMDFAHIVAAERANT
jgi:protein-disulfide isomerase